MFRARQADVDSRTKVWFPPDSAVECKESRTDSLSDRKKLFKTKQRDESIKHNLNNLHVINYNCNNIITYNIQFMKEYFLTRLFGRNLSLNLFRW